jgi:hypothetical protein
MIRPFLAGICILSGLIAVWGHRFPPLQDYPIWLYEAHLYEGGQNAGAVPAPFPVPNSANTAIIAALIPWLGAETAGRVFLTLILLVLGIGTLALLRAFRAGPESWPVLLMIPGLFFFCGNLNYVLGLGLLYGGMAYLAGRNAEAPPSAVLLGLLSVALFFCHGLVLGAWFVFGAGYLLRVTPRTRMQVFLGQLPTLALGIWTALQWKAPVTVAPREHVAWSFGLWLRSKLTTGIHAMAPFHSFDSLVEPAPETMAAAAAANAVAVALITVPALGGLLRIVGNRGSSRWLLLPAAVWSAAFLAIPSYFLGVHNVGQRFLPPLVLLLAANARLPRVAPWIGAAAALGAFALLGYSALEVSRVGEELEETHAVLGHLDDGDGDLVDAVLFDFTGVESPRRRPLPERVLVPRHRTLGRVHYYRKIAAGKRAPIWGTGILRERPGEFPIVASKAKILERAPSEVLCVIGPEENRRIIAGALVSRYRIAKQAHPVTILMPLR